MSEVSRKCKNEKPSFLKKRKKRKVFHFLFINQSQLKVQVEWKAMYVRCVLVYVRGRRNDRVHMPQRAVRGRLGG